MEIAKQTGQPMPGRKLGKDVLEEFMMVAAGMAVRYQPAPPGRPKKPGQNESAPGDRQGAGGASPLR
jgi:hypothetical protein